MESCIQIYYEGAGANRPDAQLEDRRCLAIRRRNKVFEEASNFTITSDLLCADIVKASMRANSLRGLLAPRRPSVRYIVGVDTRYMGLLSHPSSFEESNGDFTRERLLNLQSISMPACFHQ